MYSYEMVWGDNSFVSMRRNLEESFQALKKSSWVIQTRSKHVATCAALRKHSKSSYTVSACWDEQLLLVSDCQSLCFPHSGFHSFGTCWWDTRKEIIQEWWITCFLRMNLSHPPDPQLDTLGT